MTASRLRLLAVAALALALVAVLAVAVLGGDDDRRTVRAELDTARGLVPRNFVRVNGVKAGTVSDIALTERGTALVTMKLERWVPAPRGDATAVIRPSDLFGDVFIAFAPGRARTPLRGETIGLGRTANVSRLDDLLRVFRASARAGLQATLVELGIALERQGSRLNDTLLAVRPTLRAAGDVMRELASDRASLRTLIRDSEHVGAQASRRTQSIERMVDSFGALLDETAAHDRPLERGIERLPATLAQLRTTAGELTRTADATAPLATQLARAAPQLSTAFTRLGPFLRSTRRAATTARPTLRRATRFLRAGNASFDELGGGLRELTAASPDLRGLTRTLVAAAPQLGESLLTATAGQAGEPGRQPLDPSTSPLRRYWRGAAVLSCETFGRPVEPGCLADLLKREDAAKAGRSPRSRERAPRAPGRPAAPAAPSTAPAPSSTTALQRALVPSVPRTLRHLTDLLLAP